MGITEICVKNGCEIIVCTLEVCMGRAACGAGPKIK